MRPSIYRFAARSDGELAVKRSMTTCAGAVRFRRRRCDAHELLPLLADERGVDRPGEQGGNRPVARHSVHDAGGRKHGRREQA